MRYIKALNKIDKLRFKGLSDIDVSKAMYFCLYDITGNKKDVPSSILRSLVYLFTIDVKYNVDNDGDIAFVYSNSYKQRVEYYKTIRILASRFKSKVFFGPGKRKIHLSNLRYLHRLFSWYHTFRKNNSIKESIYYSSMLLFGYVNAIYILKAVLDNKCKSVVVLSDMHLIDSLLVQMCKKKGITTFTLQHGNFELDEPFVLSKSDYFLTYGDYSKNKAISYGMEESKLIKVGLFKLLGKKVPDRMPKKEIKVQKIGIILSGDVFADADTNMINLIVSYAKKRGKEVFVKFHPNFGKDKYPSVDWGGVTESFNTEINVEEFKNRVDVAIVLNSTVFFEYTLSLYPSFIYVDKDDSFIKEISWCRFRTEDELDDLIRMLEERREEYESKLLELRSYISITDNVEETYYNAICSRSGLSK